MLRSSIRAWDPESPAEDLLAVLDSCFASLAAGLPHPEADDPVHSAR